MSSILGRLHVYPYSVQVPTMPYGGNTYIHRCQLRPSRPERLVCPRAVRLANIAGQTRRPTEVNTRCRPAHAGPRISRIVK